MALTRRDALAGLVAAPAILRSGFASAAQILKISHQFPSSSGDAGDFRDRACRRFAAELEKRTNGELTGQVFSDSSLMKTVPQFSALRKGALDVSLYPLSYAGGEVAETNIGLMPCLVTSYEQGAAWKKAPIGQKLSQLLGEKGVVIVSWVWQSGGIASRERPLVAPDDARGLKIRGGSREFDLMLGEAGAATLNIPSNESYAALQTGACDAVLTSSTSLISFRLEEIAKHLTSGRGHSIWFMFEPLLMSKQIFDKLTQAQRDTIMQIGEELEGFSAQGAQADDQRIEDVFGKAGAKVAAMDEQTIGKWRKLAEQTAWKDFAGRNASCAEFLKLAQSIA
jgi:TRAP-type C4-dicarboxylate transport system substrate-binding protein